MAITNNNKKHTFSDINITPLTDIFLVLLIIMMVIAPSFQSVDKNIKMPEINSGTALEQKEATVSILADGSMFLNDNMIDENSLADGLNEIKDKTKETVVVVKADEMVKSAEIMKVMRAATEAGYEKLTVVGEPLNKKEQKELKEENNK